VKEIKIPELAESIEEGTIAEWLVNVGDKVSKGDAVVELETDKVNVEVHVEFDGVITEITAEAGTDVVVGDVIGKLDENGEAGATPEAAPAEEKKTEEPKAQEENAPTAAETTEESVDNSDVIATPAARKLAREKGIDLSKVVARSFRSYPS